METKKQKMIIVISVNKSKKNRIMRFVQLNGDDFGKYFSKDLLCEFSHISTKPSEKEIKIGIISVTKRIIGLSDEFVVELTGCSFTKRFSGGNFKIFTKCGPLDGPTNNSLVNEQPSKVVEVEKPTLTIIPIEIPSENSNIEGSYDEKSTITESGQKPETPIRSLQNNYSLIVCSNNRISNNRWFYFKKIA